MLENAGRIAEHPSRSTQYIGGTHQPLPPRNIWHPSLDRHLSASSGPHICFTHRLPIRECARLEFERTPSNPSDFPPPRSWLVREQVYESCPSRRPPRLDLPASCRLPCRISDIDPLWTKALFADFRIPDITWGNIQSLSSSLRDG